MLLSCAGIFSCCWTKRSHPSAQNTAFRVKLAWTGQVAAVSLITSSISVSVFQTKTWWKRFMLGCVLLTYCALKSVICFLVSLWDHWQDCSLALKFLLRCSFASVPLHHPKSMPTTHQGGSVGFVPFFKKEAVHTGNFSSRVLSNYLDNLWEKKKSPHLSTGSISVFFSSAHFIPQVLFLPCLFTVLHCLNSNNGEDDFGRAVSSSLH